MIRMEPRKPIYYDGLFKIEDGFNASMPIITKIIHEEFKGYTFNQHNNGDHFLDDTNRKRIVVRFESAFFHIFFHVLGPILYEYKQDKNIEVILLHPSKEKDIFHNSGLFVINVLRKYGIPYSVVQTHSIYPPIVRNFYYYEETELCGEFIRCLDEMVEGYRDLSISNDKKIYVSRQKKQNMMATQLHQMSQEEIDKLEFKDDLRIDNEEYLENLLRANGFEICTPEMFNSIEDQIKYFDKAKIIVSLSGSGLTNLLFMRKNTTIIELSTTQLLKQNIEFHFHFYLISSLFSEKIYVSVPNVTRKYDKIEKELERFIKIYD